MDWAKNLLKPPLGDLFKFAFILWTFLISLNRSIGEDFKPFQREAEDFPFFPHLVNILEFNIHIYQPI